MMEGGRDVPRVVCPRVLVDGVSVIESTLASSETYLLPEIRIDIQTKLSSCSASSSVFAETGAPDILHLSTLSSSKEKEPTGVLDISVCSSVDQDEGPHLLSSLKHDSSCCEIILISVGDDDRRHNDAACKGTWREDDAPSFAFLPVKVIGVQGTHDGSMKVFEVASSVTLSGFSICQNKKFDFGQSLMPEITPRSRKLSVVAPTPSRYQRPVDSLLVSTQNPSPIPTHATLKHRYSTTTPTQIKLGTENFDPQSPRVRRQKVKKGLAAQPLSATTKNTLKVRCDYDLL